MKCYSLFIKLSSHTIKPSIYRKVSISIYILLGIISKIPLKKLKSICKMTHFGVQILKDCRYYLEKLNLCNSERVRIANIPVPHVLMNFACVSPVIITCSCLLRFCILSGFDLNAMSNAFAIAVGSAQIILIYITLAFDRPAILETIDHMQSIVNNRKIIQKSSVYHKMYSLHLQIWRFANWTKFRAKVTKKRKKLVIFVFRLPNVAWLNENL